MRRNPGGVVGKLGDPTTVASQPPPRSDCLKGFGGAMLGTLGQNSGFGESHACHEDVHKQGAPCMQPSLPG